MEGCGTRTDTPDMSHHPLFNHLVLQNVISYLKYDDLKTATLVCQLWNAEATPKLQEISHIHLSSKNIEKYLELRKGPQSLVECTTRKTYHHQKFHFIGFDLEFHADPLLTVFLNEYGNDVKEAVFSKSIIPKSGTWEILSLLAELKIASFCDSVLPDRGELENKTFNNAIVTCPNVNCLEIIAGKSGQLAPWSQIFTIFPNIKSLQIHLRKPRDLTEMLEALIGSQPPIRLTDFCSYTQLGQNHILQLINISNKFKTLDILIDPHVSSDTLTEFLSSCGDILRTLKLSLGEKTEGGRNAAALNFPFGLTMKSLVNLEINGSMLTSLDFLKYTPNLKSLFVLQDDADEDLISFTTLIHDTPIPEPQLKSKLESLSMQYFMTPCCIRRVGEILCPNIKKLSIHLEDDSIRAVYSYLKNLEELWICGTEVTDEGITGIPMHVLMDPEIQNKEQLREFPYIGDCQNLRRFGLYPQPHENISDDSVHLGLMKIRGLRSVDLPQTAISDQAIRTLSKKPNVVNVNAQFFIEDGELLPRKQVLKK